MGINFNANIKVLIGGSFCGGEAWNKPASELDKCFKIYYFREGEALISDQDNTFTLESGNLYFINGHALQSQQCLKKMVVDWIHFHPESVYLDYLLKFSPCVVELTMSDFGSFFKLFPQLKYYFLDRLDETENRIVKLELQSLVQFVIAQVLGKPDNKIHFDDQDFLRLVPALELISIKYHLPLSLKEIAATCHLSPNYFHRLFLRTFHISPFAHLLQIRMEEAVRQLAYTSKVIKEIAYSVGYEDEAYFSRTFSKYYKTSPGRYRNSLRKRLP